jgi:hypothetical protein
MEEAQKNYEASEDMEEASIHAKEKQSPQTAGINSILP